MENIPPSYEIAVARNPWSLIAPYVPSAELCALNRVNRELHQVFAPCLWGNPASHFGTENDRVYVALTRFKRILKRVRLSVRELTHTLHFPPAQSEIYDGPHPEWLRDILEQLPNLQSLIVSRLPFFDHMALLALRTHSSGRRPSLGADASPTFALRLLIAPQCQNTTSQGLAEALGHFKNLAFLDLSKTLAARDRTVLARLRDLPLLQVLKLRKIHLRDDDMICLADAIGIRVRSLDVSGNDLTDHSVRTLLGTCFDTSEDANGSGTRRPRAASNMPVEDWPCGFVRPDPAVLDEFRDRSYDERFVRRLTSRVVSRLPFEDLPQSGITHLYISDNELTVEGLAALIRSMKLHVLDAGSIDAMKTINRPRSNSSTPPPGHVNGRYLDLPGVEKLNPILARCGQEMTSLRINHSLLTGKAPPAEEGLPLAVCELALEHPATELDAAVPQVAELDNTAPPLYELDSQEVAPQYELPAESVQATLSPAVRKRPRLSLEDQKRSEVHRGSVFAPEVDGEPDEVEEDDDLPPVLTATGLGSMAQAINGVAGTSLSPLEGTGSGTFALADGDPKLSLALIQRQRADLRAEQLSMPHGLTPGMLPKLRDITLTEVPCYDHNRKAVNALISFIKYCSSETELATLEARIKPHTQRKPGQPNSRNHHRHSAREIFALRRIILEMAPAEPSNASSLLSPQTPRTSKFMNRTLSSTEDADSEAFWTASEGDFTFFDDEEECGLPAAETGTLTRLPFSALSEKMVMMPSDGSQPGEPPALPQKQKKARLGEGPVDVIQEVASFRKERKSAYEEAVKSGVKHVAGYWSGEVKVFRGHSLGASGGGKLDYYGNYSEKGIYR